ncbi:WG repeat-containing protein [Agrobacterium tumefaciens]|nr:WG repeat-containing protein [Agrobacterium tumefaciens]NTE18423.1 WG repeat-containing protein [Agrobacterium tumefaciens]
MISSIAATSQDLPKQILYPWKSKSGLIGFSDQDNQIKITPQYEDASVFTNEFSIVQKDGKNGVIDQTGAVKLDNEYDRIELVAIGKETLAITKRTYNAWWKIQKWKIFPGFSVMGGSNDKRWFNTDVPRINWRVILLGNHQTIINSNHNPNEYPYPTSGIRSFQDKILINDQLYQISKGKIRIVCHNITAILANATLLQKKGNSYQILDQHLKPLNNDTFKIPALINVEVNGYQQEIQTERIDGGIRVKLNFIQNQDQHVFIYPDLNKLFPIKIAPYFDQKIEATSILEHASLISAIPNSPYFIIRSNVENKSAFYVLHQNGTWESDRKKTKDFVISSNGGKLMYPDASELGINRSLPTNFNIKRVEQICTNKSWFLVTGSSQNSTDTRSGIFDTDTQNWILPMEYASLNELTAYPDLWRFELQNESNFRKKKFGLIDITTKKITVSPFYNSLDENAKAGIFNGEKWDYFYINPLTGTAYKE